MAIHFDLIFRQAHIYDGVSQVELIGDLAINDDRIVAIAPQLAAVGRSEVDARGLVLAPGFVDVQNHSDTYWQLFDNPTLDSMVAQGYTTILVGNSGSSLAPLLSEQALLSIQKWHALNGTNLNWRSFSEFAQTMQASSFGCNIGSLVGYSTLRRGLIGDRQTPLQRGEFDSLVKAFVDSLSAGAFGISAGLSYAHELFISENELRELAEVAAKHDVLFAMHPRNDSGDAVSATEAIIELFRTSKVRGKLAHLKVRNPQHWHMLPQVLQSLERAASSGVDVHFDTYPYTVIWQPLYSYLPSWVMAGGRKAAIASLSDPVQRQKVLTSLENSESNLGALVVTSTSAGIKVNGKTIGAIAAGMGVSAPEAIISLIEHGGSELLVLDDCLEPEGVASIVMHPLGVIASNGGGFPLTGEQRLVHPRCFGSAPRFLRQALDSGHISLGEAISKLTSRPAYLMGLKNRGQLQVDYQADLVLFNPETITDRATISNPFQFPVGIEGVWVNGQPVVQHGQVLRTKPGEFLTR